MQLGTNGIALPVLLAYIIVKLHFTTLNRHIQIGTQAVGKFLSLCYTTAHWEGNTWEGGAIRGNVQFEAGNFGLCAATNNTEAEN